MQYMLNGVKAGKKFENQSSRVSKKRAKALLGYVFVFRGVLANLRGSCPSIGP